MRNIFLLLITICLSSVLCAQSRGEVQRQKSEQEVLSDSIRLPSELVQDSIKQTKKKLSLKKPDFLSRDFYRYKDGYPNPKASLFLSFALPGTGQIYNKKFWKAPLIYGGLGGMIYLLDDSSSKFIAYRTAYKRSISEGSPVFQSPLIEPNLSSAALKIQRDKYEKRRTLSYVGTIAVYGLFALEAFVDAHLQSFDISKDLSFEIKPSIQEHYSLPGLGIIVSVK
jgi:hypothetical protein